MKRVVLGILRSSTSFVSRFCDFSKELEFFCLPCLSGYINAHLNPFCFYKKATTIEGKKLWPYVLVTVAHQLVYVNIFITAMTPLILLKHSIPFWNGCSIPSSGLLKSIRMMFYYEVIFSTAPVLPLLNSPLTDSDFFCVSLLCILIILSLLSENVKLKEKEVKFRSIIPQSCK